jgi:large subunit ribosomal protein L22
LKEKDMASTKQETKRASEAHLRNFRMAPRKLSVVAALIRGKDVGSALNILRFTPRAAAEPIAKLIKSAVANATDLSKGEVDIDTLYVKHISVDQGPSQRRYMPRAMGRASRINKKSSHVHVVLASAE